MVSNAEIAHTYSRMQLETAAHPRIIWMMHAKCAQFLRHAAVSPPPERRMLLTRAQNLLAELEGCLKVSDQVSKGLFYLYDYCYCLLDTDKPEDHTLALNHIVQLSDAFRTLLKKNF
jgi:flagellin-specific chaperone FliS